MKVHEVMDEKITLVAPSTSLKEAAEKMTSDHIGFLPVGDNDRLMGTVTDRDIITRGISKGKDAQSTPVSDVFTGDLIYCYEDQDVEEVARLMGSSQVRRLPVVNSEKRLVGVISIGDMAQHLSQETAGQILADVTAHA